MRRIITDIDKIPKKILKKLLKLYPDGYTRSDVIIFTNSRNETIEALEIKANDTDYLVRVGKKLENVIQDYEDYKNDDDKSESDFFDLFEENEEVD